MTTTNRPPISMPFLRGRACLDTEFRHVQRRVNIPWTNDSSIFKKELRNASSRTGFGLAGGKEGLEGFFSVLAQRDLCHVSRRSACAADRPSGASNQPTQSRVDGSVVRKMFGDVGREQHKIGTCRVTRRIFSANPAPQF